MRARAEGILVERTRLAGELHDTLLQGFTGIALQLESVRNNLGASSDATRVALTRVLALAYATLRETRQMVSDMRSPHEDATDLDRALEETATIMTGGAVQLRYVVNGTRRRLSPVTEATVLRIGREAVANVVKHADARTVDVELTYAPTAVQLAVRDDGRGASCLQLESASRGGHWGIVGMRERATRAGASLHIHSELGEGTNISLSVPTDADTYVHPREA
ncbi:MAG: sensor histidine kinase [bacterium]